MENRERDKVSRNNTGPTDAGEVNRETEARKDKTGTADFGGNIGRSEDITKPDSNDDTSGKSFGDH